MKCKLTLEQRITRLEKLLNSKAKKSRKFEGVDIGNLRFDVEEWFGNHMASPNYFDSVDEWKENIEALMNGTNDIAVDDCIDNILSGGDFDEDEVFEHSDEIAMTLASLAEDVGLDGWDEDFESKKRQARKPVRNESSMTVPRSLRGKKVPLIRQGNNSYFEVPDMLNDKGLPYVYNADWLAERILDNGWDWFERTFVLVNPDKDMKYLEMLVDDEDMDNEDWDDGDDWDEDDDWDDEMDECRGRSCESRKRPNMKRKTESKRSVRRTRNEDVKRLPNGAMANRVSDVLSAWADTGWSRPQDAIRELDRQGILDAAVNKWYPTADDVAAAIEDCWDDSIGAVGAGAAQFFIGNIGGVTKCSLTLYPVTGGTSRARNIVLKFNWPDEDIEM